jgi:hypothetical protein
MAEKLEKNSDDDPTVKQLSFREDAHMSIDDKTRHVENQAITSQSLVQPEEVQKVELS